MEWQIVTTIIALVGFGAVVIKPIVSLTSAITKLTTVVDRLQQDVESLTSKNSDGHKRLWERNSEQDAKIDDHEKRITGLEGKEKNHE